MFYTQNRTLQLFCRWKFIWGQLCEFCLNCRIKCIFGFLCMPGPIFHD